MSEVQSLSLDAISQRLAALEAESAIRALVARYMELCDHLTPASDMEELGGLFATDAIWQGSGKSYKSAFGGHEGREAIVAFLRSYADPAHFTSNVHFLTSESLSVSGEKAEGSWVMLQTPTFHDEQSFVLAARLNLQFVFEDDAWRISRFQTTNLFGRPIEGGWHSETAIPVPQQNTVRGEENGASAA